MTDLTYNMTREDAAEQLDLSTRTLDRYIKKGVFSYKKIANRVYLASEEVDQFSQGKGDVQRNTPNSEIIGEGNMLRRGDDLDQIDAMIKSNMDSFVKLISDKDTKLEEKNNIIFALQSKVSSLESQLKNTIALPDYSKEKEDILIQKERVEIEKQLLVDDLAKEKIKNIIYLVVLIAIIGALIFNLF